MKNIGTAYFLECLNLARFSIIDITTLWHLEYFDCENEIKMFYYRTTVVSLICDESTDADFKVTDEGRESAKVVSKTQIRQMKLRWDRFTLIIV